MKLKKIMSLSMALGFFGFFGCSSNSKKEIDPGTVFEQKVSHDHKGNLNKVVDGVKIDASFSNPNRYTFYEDGGIRAGLWLNTEYKVPEKTTSELIKDELLSPYLQEVGISNAKDASDFNLKTEGKREEIRKKYNLLERDYYFRTEGVLEKSVSISETKLTDYFHDDGKPEAFVVPAFSEQKLGAHVFFDKDYIKKIKNPEIAMIYRIAGRKKAGCFFSYLGKINLKKTNDVYCGYFEINADVALNRNQLVFLIGNFKKKDSFIPIEPSFLYDLRDDLKCSEKLAEIIGNSDCIMFGLSYKLFGF